MALHSWDTGRGRVDPNAHFSLLFPSRIAHDAAQSLDELRRDVLDAMDFAHVRGGSCERGLLLR